MGSHPKYDGNLTTYIHDEEERMAAVAVPGRDGVPEDVEEAPKHIEDYDANIEMPRADLPKDLEETPLRPSTSQSLLFPPEASAFHTLVY
ncbi:hypothetical protein HGRIS_003807 [Hohenbuehelia grisea]|uniref:Uncharacterized protein n=1 Tax=Hohenbuehelia grisea TaxID=104357 RepID=A0ABR3JGL6_9AGAR